MLEGLTEVSIVPLSEIEKIKKRIDSEYYQKHYLKLENKINLIGKVNIKGINAKLDCSAFYPSITDYYNFEFEGVPFLRVNEIQNGLVTITQNTAFLPQDVLDNNPSTIAVGNPGDIVIAKGGNTLAKLGLITNQFPTYALSRDLILLRTENLKDCNKYFLWAFLHSNYGQDLLWRTASQTGQPHLTLPAIEEIGLPRYSNDFEDKFEALYKRSGEVKEKSKQIYKQAENLLLEVVGLKDFEPSKEKTNVKNFSKSFLSTGRLDAEYYQPKYDELFYLLNGNAKKNNWSIESLGNLSEPLRYGSSANLEYLSEGVPFLRIADVRNYRFDKESLKYISVADAKEESFASVKKGDVIISRSGTLGLAVAIGSELEDAIFGSYFIRIRPNGRINPEFLAFYINSKAGQMQVEQLNTGGIQTNLTVPAMESLKIALPPKDVQDEIVANVRESFATQDKSKNLLEIAKRAVETAIEETEEKAIEFIEDAAR